MSYVLFHEDIGISHKAILEGTSSIRYSHSVSGIQVTQSRVSEVGNALNAFAIFAFIFLLRNILFNVDVSSKSVCSSRTRTHYSV